MLQILLSIGTQVQVFGDPVLTGVIEGYAYFSVFGPATKYIVKLDKGFYSPDKTVFVSLLVVDPTNLIAQEG